MGGIGNYMFQIAATYVKSLELGYKFLIDKRFVKVGHNNIETYKNNLLRNLQFENLNDFDEYYERVFNYEKIKNFENSTMLRGYFQSEKYFKEYENEVRNFFSCPNEIKNKLLTKYDGLHTERTCSIHVRRGDYVKLQNYHPLQTIDYYNRSIESFGKDFLFFVFSDDIEWCKSNLTNLKNVFYCENNKDYEDLYLMSLCKNNIIANSSFSWWSAWLNENRNKKVIAPTNWFGKSNSHLNTKDLYCDNWIIL